MSTVDQDKGLLELLVVYSGEVVFAYEQALRYASLPSAELDATRSELRERSSVPVLLVHGGLRPSGLAPERSLTRFTWSVAPQ